MDECSPPGPTGQYQFHGPHHCRHRLERRRVGDRGAQGLDPGGVDRLVGTEGVALGAQPRRPAEAADPGAELAFDDQLREVLVAQPLPGGPARVGGREEALEDLLVEFAAS